MMLLAHKERIASPPVVNDFHNYSSERQRQIFPSSNQNNCLGNGGSERKGLCHESGDVEREQKHLTGRALKEK